MSKRRIVVPTKIEDLNKYQMIALPYLKLNMLRLLVSDADILELNVMITDPVNGWAFLHNKHSDPLTKTEPGNADLMKCKVALTKKLQYVYRNIPRNVMISADFQTLNIAEPTDHKTKRGTIVNTPFGLITAIGGGILKFEVRTNAEAKTARMDDLADVVRVMGMILKPGEDLPTDPSQCTVTFTSTKANFKHTFSVAEAGNRFVCFLQYVNQSDESKNGPISKLQICIIGL